MKSYPVKKIRNVCFMGHGGDGKTSLAEAMLFISKATDRLGKISDGNTVMDFDPEEMRRKASISLSIAPVEWGDCKINIIDVPGYFDFVGEAMQGIRAADAAVIVVNGKAGVFVGTEKAVSYADNRKLPKIFFINRLDEENADFDKTFEQLKELYGVSICPVEIPITEGGDFKGCLNLITMKAKSCNKNGEDSEIDIPRSLADKVDEMRNILFEAVAETDEELMEKYFSGEEFTEDEIIGTLHKGILSGDILPVLCGSATSLHGIPFFLDMIKDFFPSPDELQETGALDADGSEISIKCDEKEPVSAIVFKTVADPYVGKMSYFKVASGVLKSDTVLLNSNKKENEKISRLFIVKGKKQIETDAISTGDIGVVTKLALTNTGDTLCDPSRPVTLKGIDFAEPNLSMAIIPHSKGDEEKISSGLSKLAEEDLTFKFYNNAETHQQIISGLGETHIDVIVSKLKNKFGTMVVLTEPKVPYRETIRKKVKVEGKHKKQSGGHGQYGHVWIEFEPGDSEDLIFEEKVFGGAVPKNYFPAVEKGLRDCIAQGVLAGYPVVNLKARLVDGSYHPVDSSEMSFKIAASLAYKAGLAKANPVLLEPIGLLKVKIPDTMMGDIIGDINKRRGQVLGMNSASEGIQEVEAEVPMAEMGTYAIDLRSLSRARGEFTFEFVRYQEAPPAIAQKVIDETNKESQKSS